MRERAQWETKRNGAENCCSPPCHCHRALWTHPLSRGSHCGSSRCHKCSSSKSTNCDRGEEEIQGEIAAPAAGISLFPSSGLRQTLVFMRAWKRLPGVTPNFGAAARCCHNPVSTAIRIIVGFLVFPGAGPGPGLDGPCGFLPAQNILWFCNESSAPSYG